MARIFGLAQAKDASKIRPSGAGPGPGLDPDLGGPDPRHRQAMGTPSNWERHNIKWKFRGGVEFCFFGSCLVRGSVEENKIQNHSHEIRLEKLVCMLFLPYHFAITRYHNIEKPLKKINYGTIWPGHPPESSRIPMNSSGFRHIR